MQEHVEQVNTEHCIVNQSTTTYEIDLYRFVGDCYKPQHILKYLRRRTDERHYKCDYTIRMRFACIGVVPWFRCFWFHRFSLWIDKNVRCFWLWGESLLHSIKMWFILPVHFASYLIPSATCLYRWSFALFEFRSTAAAAAELVICQMITKLTMPIWKTFVWNRLAFNGRILTSNGETAIVIIS